MKANIKTVIITLFLVTLLIITSFFVFGCINGDCKNGNGTFRYLTFTTYSGNWLLGKKNGFGIQKWSLISKWPGDRYEGNWYNDEKHGSGKYYWNDGGILVGKWDNGNKTYGIHTYGTSSEWANDWYEGSFKGDNKHGSGKYYDISDDIIYEGNFHENRMHGKAKVIFGKKSLSPNLEYIGIWDRGNNYEFRNILDSLMR